MSCSSTAAKGARLTVNSACWHHVHHDLSSVFDFTFWVREHPGTSDAINGNRRNPIEAFAAGGNTTLTYPSHHLMADWASRRKKSDARHYFLYLGRLGDEIAFNELPTHLQSPAMASVLGATSSGGGAAASTGVEACGSPGEVANEPARGHVFSIFQSYEKLSYQDRKIEWLTPHNHENSKAMV